MSILKKTLSTIIIFILLLHIIGPKSYAAPNTNHQNPIKVAVFLYNANVPLYAYIKQELENIQKENENKVQFTFLDSKTNQGTQDDNIAQALNTGEFDLYVVSPVSRNIEQLNNSVFKVIQNKIPLIILAPPDPSLAKYLQNSNSVIIGGDDQQSGILQGETIVDIWNSNKELFDRNKDNTIQYALIQGPTDDPSTILRTKYSIQTINDAGIKTQEIFSTPCYWLPDCSKVSMENVFLTLSGRLEAIISNNDGMAVWSYRSPAKIWL